jgi:hypothetical protein
VTDAVATASVTTVPVTAAPVTSTTASSATSSSIANQYAHHGLIGALQALVKDLSNSQILTSATGTNLSSNTISTLNSAFQQLISALGGNTSATTPSSSSTATSSTTSGTAALQSFLTNLLDDLQNNGSSSVSALGGTVNTTA